MKKNNRLQNILIVAAVVALSSCNRGYGCPTNFSVDELIETIAQVAVRLFF